MGYLKTGTGSYTGGLLYLVAAALIAGALVLEASISNAWATCSRDVAWSSRSLGGQPKGFQELAVWGDDRICPV